MLPTVQSAPVLQGKRVLVRASLNVPVEDGIVRDDFRITKALRTIFFLRDQGARVIVMSHLSGDANATLAPVHQYLQQHLSLYFVSDVVGPEARRAVEALSDGDVLLLENIRQHPGEKENAHDFAKQLSTLAEYYVQDDFTVAHRAHASVALLPTLVPTYAGFQFQDEYAHLSTAFKAPKPSLLILAGGKAGTKIPIAKRFLHNVDHIFIGGVAANMFFIAQGYPIGKSIIVEGDFGIASMLKETNIALPTDVVIRDTQGVVTTKSPKDIQPGEMILDAGTTSVEALIERIHASAFVLWNGPLGFYEEGFDEATDRVAEALAKSNAYSVIGGGDTIAAIRKLGLLDDFTFVSTAGGAMLSYLADGKLVGVTALEKAA